MYSPDLYSQGDVGSVLSSYEIDSDSISVAGEEVLYTSATWKKKDVSDSIIKDYSVIEEGNDERTSCNLGSRVDLKVSVLRKIDVDHTSPSSWFPKKVVITTDSRRFETTAWAHCSSNQLSTHSSNELPCPMENSPESSIALTVSTETTSLDDLDCTRCGSAQDPSLSSINASSWYPSQTSAIPPTSSPNPDGNFGLSHIGSERNTGTNSLISRSASLNNDEGEEPEKPTRSQKRFGIEVRLFNIPVNVLSAKCQASIFIVHFSSDFHWISMFCRGLLINFKKIAQHCENMRKFMRSGHILVSNVGCEVDGCTRAFSLEANLKSHIKTHTGEKPHKCQFCDYAFSHPYNLRVHITRRHKEKKLS
ncbi:hypothetical protein KIN20_004504 [Parelaphostrongylus tenuis]|uniref:C2H2-type domain-containing protein n=1 Tax=Parelaphostrongylus tenuis TaxID=148309 RepID=A0AAD5QJE1_PARTN|nr:hypothetical protein KIN20_004504 [Parelaphostrongylus tenuis]